MKKNDVHRLEFFFDFNKKIKDINRFIHTFKRYELAVKFLKEKNNPTILDVGCGNNDFLKNFNIHPKYYKAPYDFSKLKILKTKLRKNYIIKTLYQNYPLNFISNISSYNKKKDFFIFVKRNK